MLTVHSYDVHLAEQSRKARYDEAWECRECNKGECVCAFDLCEGCIERREDCTPAEVGYLCSDCRVEEVA